MAMDQFLMGVSVCEAVRQQLLMGSPKTLGEAIRKVRQLEAAQLLLRQSAQAQPEQRIKSKVASASQSVQPSEMTKMLELLTKMETRLTNTARGTA
jgi:hypothetical protein